MKILRRKSKVIKIRNVCIGGQNPVVIQSMVKVPAQDIEKTVSQIRRLQDAGCQIVRLAVKDSADAQAIRGIKKKTHIPLIADIHFDWRLALEAIESGADKIRLNPGNIYKKEHIEEIVRAAKSARIPIRVGLNSGSLPKEKSNGSMADKMVKSAMDYIRILEGFGFYDIVVSLKASHLTETIEAYRKMSGLCEYPLHLGLTATGLPLQGIVASSIGIGALLLEGIGDTIRVSLTDIPEQEVKIAKYILEALGMRSFGPKIISCPTCGRCEVDLVSLVQELERKLSAKHFKFPVRPLEVAVMGCIVNGPGEAKDAHIGIAFGKKEGMLFRNAKPIKKVSYSESLGVLLKYIKGAYA